MSTVARNVSNRCRPDMVLLYSEALLIKFKRNPEIIKPTFLLKTKKNQKDKCRLLPPFPPVKLGTKLVEINTLKVVHSKSKEGQKINESFK